MTDPTGRSFLSYPRSRANEARLLVLAQHDVGIPTWQDIANLEHGPTEEQLRAAIADPLTASGLLWITPEVADSAIIRNVEIPGLLKRADSGDAFFVTAVAAGGLDYQTASKAAQTLGITDLSTWNLERALLNPIDSYGAADLARKILHQRLNRIHEVLAPTAPIRLYFTTRDAAQFQAGTALTIDWSHRFGGFQSREATTEIWNGLLLPALSDVANAVKSTASGRAVEATGYPTIPAAIALGAAFLAPKGMNIMWRQRFPDGSEQLWGLSTTREAIDFRSDTQWLTPDSQDIALLVSVTEDVSQAVAASRSDLARWRAILHVHPEGTYPHTIDSPGKATDLAHLVVQSARDIRREAGNQVRFHLFAATPAGLAVMIGQLLNTLGPIQTYEHLPIDAIGQYKTAALLQV